LCCHVSWNPPYLLESQFTLVGLHGAHEKGGVENEVGRFRRRHLVPFDTQAANLMFMLVSRRYERASLIVTSNKPFSAGARSSATTWSPPR
jgi:hypothetical protein